MINTEEISSIIFDLGGVLLNLNYQLSIQAFTDLGIQNANQLFSQAQQTKTFDDFETGKISANEFRATIKNLIPNSVTDEQVDNAWNSMLLDFPQERFEFLKKVTKTHRIFLLSNTNEIHMAWFKNYLNKQYGKDAFFNLFEVAYLSNEIGMRKPHKEIFEFVCKENNLNPQTTLFIDDSAQHLVGAKKAGLQTVWLEPGMETVKILSDFLT